MVPPVVLLVVIFIGETEQRMLVWPTGLILFGAGLVLRIWDQMHLHYRLPIHKILTATGPYAHVRNPIYIGNTAILLGLTVLSELLWFLPFMLLWCMAVYGLVVRREEEHLLKKYGEPYAAFLRETRPAFARSRLAELPRIDRYVSREDEPLFRFGEPSLTGVKPTALAAVSTAFSSFRRKPER